MKQRRAALGLLALAVLGWAASLYLLVEHIRARITLSLGGACDINEVFNCTAAALSPYSQVAGAFPTAGLGVAYYVGFGLIAVALLRGRDSLAPVLTGLAALASLYSIALFTLSVVQLRTLCPGCSVTYLVNFASLAVCLTTFRPMPKLDVTSAAVALAGFGAIIFAGTFGLGTWAQARIAEGERIAESERAVLAVKAAEMRGLSKDDVERIAHHPAAPANGSPDAAINIAVYSDFQCPHCALFAAELRRLHQHFGRAMRVEYHFYPLPGHQWADLGARIGTCVPQDKFWQYHDAVFEKQDGLNQQVLAEIVDDLGLRTGDIMKCAESDDAKAHVSRDIVAGNRLSIEGTPAFVLRGELTTGVVPYDRMEQRIAALLQSSEQAQLRP